LVVTYIEPAEAGPALGLDVLQDHVRRRVAERARDEDRLTASPPVIPIVGEDGERSVVLAMPIYRRDRPTATVEERREAFFGLVASAVRISDLVYGLLQGQLGRDFHLLIRDLGPDGAVQPAAAEVIFNSDPRATPAAPSASPSARLVQLEVGGRRWQLEFRAPPQPVHPIGGSLPEVILLGGVLTSLLVSWLVLMQSVARERAVQLARQAAQVRAAEEAREQLAFIQNLIEAVPQPIFFKDTQGRYLGVNR